ncbi:MAG TPA: ABC transporter substrate-binding protein [Candidatus Binataceae bacterium]|nr:ABC transporter substrate-binding protein [Candidatus Binataceae bacterium]
MKRDLTVGLSLSLSGRYAPMGRQAEAALRLWAQEVNANGGIRVADGARRVILECFDDESRVERVREIYRELCFGRRADLLLGPYSSSLTRAAATIAEQAQRPLLNHGGAADRVQDGSAMTISVLSPASDYLVRFIELLATLKFWRKRLAIASSGTAFAEAIAAGAETAATRRRMRLHGVRLRVKFRGRFDAEHTPELLVRTLRRNRINAFVSAGSYEHDLAMMRVATGAELSIPVLGCVAAGITRFRTDLGEAAEGIVGTSQWEPEADIRPGLGPAPAEFARRLRGLVGECDYPAAQSYAAALIVTAAVTAAESLESARLRAALVGLKTRTLFGDYAVDPRTGRQVGHQMLLVQWHRGHKELIRPQFGEAEAHLELPSAWQLLFPAQAYARLHRARSDDEDKV